MLADCGATMIYLAFVLRRAAAIATLAVLLLIVTVCAAVMFALYL
jgi:hypothetical protein